APGSGTGKPTSSGPASVTRRRRGPSVAVSCTVTVRKAGGGRRMRALWSVAIRLKVGLRHADPLSFGGRAEPAAGASTHRQREEIDDGGGRRSGIPDRAARARRRGTGGVRGAVRRGDRPPQAGAPLRPPPHG